MGYQVTLAPSARRDLEEIVHYISLDAPNRALELGRLLMAKTKSLVHFPEMGRIVPELGDPIIREMIVGSCDLPRQPSTSNNRNYSLLAWAARYS